MRSILTKLKMRLRGEIPTETYVKNGMRIGRNFHRLPNCTFDISHCWLITIGDNVTCAPGVRIIAHDASTCSVFNKLEGAKRLCKISPITIGNNVFIGAGSIILCGVHIGNNVVIGAGTIVTKSIPDNSVAYGNPVKVVASYDTFMEKHLKYQSEKPCFSEEYTIRKGVSIQKKQEMKDALNQHGFGYIE